MHTIKNAVTSPHFILSPHPSFRVTYTLLFGTNPNQSRFNLLYQYLAVLKYFKSNIWTIPLRKLKWWVQIVIYCGRTLYLWPKYFKIWGLKSKCSAVLGIKCYSKEKKTIFWFDLLMTLNFDPDTFDIFTVVLLALSMWRTWQY